MKLKFLMLSMLASIFFYQIAAGQLIIKDTLSLAGQNEPLWHSSSELEQSGYYNYGKYGAINLGDNNSTTCWAEGVEGDGVGEYIYMTIPKNIRGIKIRNGFQKSESIYKANNRPKKIEIELMACFSPSGFVTETHIGFAISQPLGSLTQELDDKMGYQDVILDFDWYDLYNKIAGNNNFDNDRFILKITIKDIYKGNKWNDACISDILMMQNPVFDVTDDDQGFIRIFENKTDTLFYDPENVYQVIDFTEDSEWIIFIQMPADIGNSRVENIYKLYNTQKECFIETQNVFQMYGFEEKEGKLYLNGINNNFEEINFLLEEIKKME